MNRVINALDRMNAIGGEFHSDPGPDTVLGAGSDELCRRLGIEPGDAKAAAERAVLPYAIHIAQSPEFEIDPTNAESFRLLIALLAASFLDGLYTAGFMEAVPAHD
jgi:hypothetical protein